MSAARHTNCPAQHRCTWLEGPRKKKLSSSKPGDTSAAWHSRFPAPCRTAGPRWKHFFDRVPDIIGTRPATKSSLCRRSVSVTWHVPTRRCCYPVRRLPGGMKIEASNKIPSPATLATCRLFWFGQACYPAGTDVAQRAHCFLLRGEKISSKSPPLPGSITTWHTAAYTFQFNHICYPALSLPATLLG